MGELIKAHLIELAQGAKKSPPKEKDDGQKVEVQFNPESLKVTYANQLAEPKGGNQASGNAGRQFVGAGTTKLALQLWFDVTAMEKDPVDDVRRLTSKVLYFMTPQGDDPNALVPPGVRFSWSSFLFDGIVEGMEETLEYFSPDGKPLRASITMTLSQQKILQTTFEGDGKVPKRAGQSSLFKAKAGDSLQAITNKAGKGDWQSIASANGIEDSLRLNPGQLLNLNAGVPGIAGSSPGISMTGTSGLGARPKVELGGSLGAGISGSFGVN